MGDPHVVLRVPNGVFQMVFFRFLTSGNDREVTFQSDKGCPKTPVFSGILVPSALADPGHSLHTHHSEKHRLENTVCYRFGCAPNIAAGSDEGVFAEKGAHFHGKWGLGAPSPLPLPQIPCTHPWPSPCRVNARL